ncbi:MAG TPA: DUF6335 family protein [Vicinamibacteria bacterium]|jgi:hypothetical protein|nr:DUF6335 family protein [Vicinamibacteria bacterium]
MASRPARKSDDRALRALRLRRVDDAAPRLPSPTAVAAEALRTGILPPHVRRRQAIPREDDILVGDPDDLALANEYVGEDTPGASTPTPDQNGVDEIGRAYGLQEEDTGVLRSGAEVLGRRDRHRHELLPPRRQRP